MKETGQGGSEREKALAITIMAKPTKVLVLAHISTAEMHHLSQHAMKETDAMHPSLRPMFCFSPPHTKQTNALSMLVDIATICPLAHHHTTSPFAQVSSDTISVMDREGCSTAMVMHMRAHG